MNQSDFHSRYLFIVISIKDKGLEREPSIELIQLFSGYKCPIRLVKTQKQ